MSVKAAKARVVKQGLLLARLLTSLAFLGVLFSAPSASAQAFAGMGAEVDGFTLPQPGPTFHFPRDHGPHPDFRIEWWYITANLTSADGTPYGIQWTLFRTALQPDKADADVNASQDVLPQAWASNQIWFCHAAVTGQDFHHVSERYARGGVGQAGVKAAPFEAWCDDWSMAGEDLTALTLKASGPDFRYSLTLSSDRPLVLHGQGGYSVKSSSGQASYYYSQPAFQAKGTLSLPAGDVVVEGAAWLDREWSSQPLSKDQKGWDWFSLKLDDGSKLMTYRLRGDETYSTATWMKAGQAPRPLSQDMLEIAPSQWSRVAGRTVPTQWTIKAGDTAGGAAPLDIVIKALNPQSWMDLSIPYWEGPVRISGSHTGVGYLEMTGYE